VEVTAMQALLDVKKVAKRASTSIQTRSRVLTGKELLRLNPL